MAQRTSQGSRTAADPAAAVTPACSIYVAGHRGMVGSAIARRLRAAGFDNLITRDHAQLDLCDQAAVLRFFQQARPDCVILAAARVGGIHANNTYPADFIRDNLQIQTNVVDAAWRHGARKLVFLGSSCIYPKHAPQPMPEDCLLGGPLEPTNQWYAIAKIAGIKLCQAYRRQYGFNAISLMPTNLYGPEDNFHLDNAHVLPALMHRFQLAKENGDASVPVWGSGTPKREFLHVDDLADATLFLLQHYDGEDIVNVGTGTDVTIAELAAMIKDVVGYPGDIVHDASKPDGTPRKLLDVSRLRELGWAAQVPLRDGLESTYGWFMSHRDALRA